MTVNVLGESYTLNFISEEEDEGLKDCDGYCDDTIKTLVVKQYKRGEPGSRKHLISKKRRTSGMRSSTHFSAKVALRKTPHGRRRKKWWIGLPSSFLSWRQRFGRLMPCEKPPA